MSPEGSHHMAALVLGGRRAMVGTRWVISLPFCTKHLLNHSSHRVGPLLAL